MHTDEFVELDNEDIRGRLLYVEWSGTLGLISFLNIKKEKKKKKKRILDATTRNHTHLCQQITCLPWAPTTVRIIRNLLILV